MSWGIVDSQAKADAEEKRIFAKVLRLRIAMLGKTTVRRIQGETVSHPEIASIPDEDLTSENGYYILSNNIPIFGDLVNERNRGDKILSFREMSDGRLATALPTQYIGATKISKSVIPEAQAQAIGAVDCNDGDYYIKHFPFDFSSALAGNGFDEIVEEEEWGE
jgi:hypothetical protein